MRTKTVLLTAILSAAGMASSFAQGVYSVNVVGYVTVTVTNAGKYNILANPLIATNNKVSVLIPSVPVGTAVLKLKPNGQYDPNAFSDDFDPPAWTNPDMELPLGEGFFFRLPPGAPNTTLTFVGEVAQREASNKTIPGTNYLGVRFYALQGSMVPQAGGMVSVLQMPNATVGDAVLQLSPDGAYVPSSFSDDFDPPAWTADLNLKVAEGFFTRFWTPVPWNRNFVVPTP